MRFEHLSKMSITFSQLAFDYFDNAKQTFITNVGPALINSLNSEVVADTTNVYRALVVLISEQPEQYNWFMKWYFTRPESEVGIY